MIASIGTGALITVTLLCFVLPMVLWKIQHIHSWAKEPFTRVSQIFITGMITGALGALAVAFYLNDFSVRVVAEHGHTTMSTLHRLGALWGHHEGSMLLFIWIYALYGFCYPQEKWKSIAFHWFFLGCFLLYLTLLSNPFESMLHPPLEGGELNPLLQDILLIIHPPILYAGYAGFAVPFCLALDHVLDSKASPSFLINMRIATLMAWSFLTLGVALGSLWAYDELGWGGWWFWDPVENASLLPWIFGTCLLHAVQGSKHHSGWSVGVIGFAYVSYAMTLVGFILIRSGLLSSVHAFASDPGRGQGLVCILIVTMGVAALCWTCRKMPRPKGRELLNLYARGAWYWIFLAIWSAVGFTLFLGTLYPLLSDFLGGTSLSVGAPYFVKTVVPLAVCALVPMAIVLILAWHPLPVSVLMQRGQTWVLGALGAVLLWGYFFSFMSLLHGIAFILAAFVLISVWTRPAKWPLKLAHGGFALCLMGMIFDTSLSVEQSYALKPGQHVNVSGKKLIFERIERGKKGSYAYEKAYVRVESPEDKDAFFYLFPEKRFYPSHQTLKTETAIKDTFFSHLYVVLGGILPDGRWTFRIATHPLVDLIWLGALAMALGGFWKMTIFIRRRRQL